MHYGDEEWIHDNRLSIVIYKCEDLSNGKFDYDLCSIYESRNIRPSSLVKFIYSFEFIFSSELDALDGEGFYLFNLKQNDFDSFVLESVKNVTNSPNRFLQLH